MGFTLKKLNHEAHIHGTCQDRYVPVLSTAYCALRTATVYVLQYTALLLGSR